MNKIQVGTIVRACAGREKNRWYVAVAVSDGFVEICDGKERKLEKPKRKNIKHISLTEKLIETSALTNKKLRKLIGEFSTQNSTEADRQPLAEEVF